MFMNWMRIGYRNLAKNRRRSAFTVLAIAFGFAAVNLLGGFTHYVYKGLEEGYVYAQGNGHLTVFHKGFRSEGSLDSSSFLIDKQTADTIAGICAKNPQILLITPQLSISGLVSNGNVSTIMIAEGRVPSDLRKVQQIAGGFLGRLKYFEGSPLEDGAGGTVGMAHGLAAKLHLALGNEAIILTNTVDGFMNALDARLVQTFEAPWSMLENMAMMVPLAFAQKLYATESVDRINIILADPQQAEAMVTKLQHQFETAGLSTEVLLWSDLHPSYSRTRNMFNVIFSISFLIVMVIVVMSVVNTVSTAVLERTREIGTLRALGLKRSGVITMFVTESVLLATIGSVAGMLLTVCGWIAVVTFKPTWIPPHIPKRIPLEIHLVPGYLALTFFSLIILAAIAAAIPARRAAKLPIIDALGHN